VRSYLYYWDRQERGQADCIRSGGGLFTRKKTWSLHAIYRKYGDIIMGMFRWDLQLHFFGGFSLTLLGVFWLPLLSAGLLVTAVKEAFDLWSKGRWSWDDVVCGVVGSALAILFLQVGGNTTVL